MFDFEKLEVYKLVREQYNKVIDFLKSDTVIKEKVKERWSNAMLQGLLNLVQASGRINSAEKKNFITISRGYIFECAALLDILKSTGNISEEIYNDFYECYERISKMLLGMYKSFCKV